MNSSSKNFIELVLWLVLSIFLLVQFATALHQGDILIITWYFITSVYSVVKVEKHWKKV